MFATQSKKIAHCLVCLSCSYRLPSQVSRSNYSTDTNKTIQLYISAPVKKKNKPGIIRQTMQKPGQLWMLQGTAQLVKFLKQEGMAEYTVTGSIWFN